MENEEDWSSDRTESIISHKSTVWDDVVIQSGIPEPLASFKGLPSDVVHAYNLMYTMIERGELSQRCFNLTSETIPHNPANYTAWWYRRRCLQSLWGANQKTEQLEFLLKELSKVTSLNLESDDSNGCYTTFSIVQHMLVNGVEINPKIIRHGFTVDGISQITMSISLEHDISSIDLSAIFKNMFVIATSHTNFMSELERLQEDLNEDLKNMNAWAQRRYIVNRFRSILIQRYASDCLKHDCSAHQLWQLQQQYRKQQLNIKNSINNETIEKCQVIQSEKCNDDTVCPIYSNVGEETNNDNHSFRNKNIEHGGCEGCWFIIEFQFANEMIRRDFRNYSTWSFRRVVVEDLLNTISSLKSDSNSTQINEALNNFRNDEIQYVIEWCSISPHNESTWNILQSYFYTESQVLSKPCSDTEILPTVVPNNFEKFRVPWTTDIVAIKISPLLDILLSFDPVNRFALYVQYLIALSKNQSDVAQKIIEKLISADPIRRNYWIRRPVKNNSSLNHSPSTPCCLGE